MPTILAYTRAERERMVEVYTNTERHLRRRLLDEWNLQPCNIHEFRKQLRRAPLTSGVPAVSPLNDHGAHGVVVPPRTCAECIHAPRPPFPFEARCAHRDGAAHHAPVLRGHVFETDWIACQCGVYETTPERLAHWNEVKTRHRPAPEA